MVTSKFNVGDLIIDSNQVHTIVKIEDEKIFYQPLDQTNDHHQCSNSIPLKNLSIAQIRHLLNSSEIKDLLKNLSSQDFESLKSTNNRINNNNLYKDIFYLNDPYKTGKLLIHLQELKKTTKLSYADQSIFDQSLNHLAKEISIVTKVSLDIATAKILAAIKR